MGGPLRRLGMSFLLWLLTHRVRPGWRRPTRAQELDVP